MVSEKCGKIINISSMWGTAGASCEAAYSASKSGLHGLTKALAKELAPSGISVNAVACGVIDTDMNSRLNEEEKKICFAKKFPPADSELVKKLQGQSLPLPKVPPISPHRL